MGKNNATRLPIGSIQEIFSSAGFANKDQVAAIEDFSDDEEIPCMVHCHSPNASLNNWTAVEIPKIFSFSKSLNKPIEHDTATVPYNLELPINQANEDGERNDELPEEMARLLEQESKEIQPNQEPVEAINLGTKDYHQTGDDHSISFIVSPASDWRRSFHHLSFHQRQTGDDHFISLIVSPASDWRRSFHIIYRFTSVRLATIIPYHLSFHQRQTGDDHLISLIVSPASDWRRSFHIIYRFTSVRLATIISSFIVSPASDWRRSFYITYRFTSVRLATIIPYHLSFHQRQTGDDHFIIYRFTSVRLATIILYHLSFHQCQTGDDHFISLIVSPASDWRRSFQIIYRFTSVRLATIISSSIVSPASDWRRSFHHLSTFSAGD
ncbi:hypothetical protein P8452_17539 [Trifolium repens]|nr:hypothetical protein P8452_17539 [Trifolium repens]